MLLPSFIPSVLKRAGLCAGLALLAGCATTPKPAVAVSSPPAPSTGSQRIVAYDAYAGTLFNPAGVRPAAVAASEAASMIISDRGSVESSLD